MSKLNKNIKRKLRNRNKLKKINFGRYRITVAKSLKNISVQIIDDQINKTIVGEKGKLLVENLEVTINFHNDTAISVELPNQVNCRIKVTDVALKGQTVSSSYKPATLENDLNIQVPPFIESGDEIVIDTRTLEYIKKI